MTRLREFALPDLGEGLTEGEILTWLVQEGDTIELNQMICEVETAKAAVELPAKWAGVVLRIHHPAGSTVEVGATIITIDTDPGAGPLPSAESLAAVQVAPAEGMIEPGMIGGPAPGGRTAVLVGYGPRTTTAKRRPRIGTPSGPTTATTAPALPTTQPVRVPPPAPVTEAAPLTGAAPTIGAAPASRVLAKPPVRKLARDLGVDLAGLTGSGPLGSITRADVEQAATAQAAGTLDQAGTPGGEATGRREQHLPVKGVRKLTAANMVASAFTAPHVTEFLTVDVTRSMKALDRLKARPEFTGLRVSPLLLVAKAVLVALRRHPMVNSTWSGDTIVLKDYVNLGIAAATERGLIVPNIKDAGDLSLHGLAEALHALVQVAKSGRTAPSDMAGGTFSITNIGVYGIDSGTPILPPGESAILALGTIRPTPWVHRGKIKIRQVTTLALSFDHRVIDGELGSRFLRDLGSFLEDPGQALLAWS